MSFGTRSSASSCIASAIASATLARSPLLPSRRLIRSSSPDVSNLHFDHSLPPSVGLMRCTPPAPLPAQRAASPAIRLESAVVRFAVVLESVYHTRPAPPGCSLSVFLYYY